MEVIGVFPTAMILLTVVVMPLVAVFSLVGFMIYLIAVNSTRKE